MQKLSQKIMILTDPNEVLQSLNLAHLLFLVSTFLLFLPLNLILGAAVLWGLGGCMVRVFISIIFGIWVMLYIEKALYFLLYISDPPIYSPSSLPGPPPFPYWPCHISSFSLSLSFLFSFTLVTRDENKLVLLPLTLIAFKQIRSHNGWVESLFTLY